MRWYHLIQMILFHYSAHAHITHPTTINWFQNCIFNISRRLKDFKNWRTIFKLYNIQLEKISQNQKGLPFLFEIIRHIFISFMFSCFISFLQNDHNQYSSTSTDPTSHFPHFSPSQCSSPVCVHYSIDTCLPSMMRSAADDAKRQSSFHELEVYMDPVFTPLDDWDRPLIYFPKFNSWPKRIAYKIILFFLNHMSRRTSFVWHLREI